MMNLFLAFGGGGGLQGSSIVLALECALVLGLAAVLMAIPILASRRRAVAGADLILAGAVLWGIVAAIYAEHFVVTKFDRAQEHMTLLMQGYEDPVTSGDQSGHPWAWWTALAVIYVILLTVAFVGKRRESGGPAQDG
jgi:hypothetical protein